MGSPDIRDNAKQQASAGDHANAPSGEAQNDATILEQNTLDGATARVDQAHVSLRSQETVDADLDDTKVVRSNPIPSSRPSSSASENTLPGNDTLANLQDNGVDATMLEQPNLENPGESKPADSATTVRKGNQETVVGQKVTDASEATLDGISHATLDAQSAVDLADGTMETIAPDQGITVKPGATVKTGGDLQPASIQTMETVDPIAVQQTGFDTVDSSVTGLATGGVRLHRR